MNRIRTLALMENAVRRLKENGAGEKDVFEFSLSCFEETPYLKGKDRPEESDCSGTVCRALSCTYGRYVRVTADELYRHYFTKTPDSDGGICAVFFIDGTGRAVHVAGYAGNGLFMNESQCEPGRCGTFRTAGELRKMYGSFRIEERGLSAEVVRV
jgi:murein DD-endopeptidase